MTHTSAFQKFRRILHQAHCQNLHSERASLPSQYQRRKFLKLSAIASSAAIATTAIPYETVKTKN
jgi:ferric-dicitrate binding protein FerR (iron transport regulator)